MLVQYFKYCCSFMVILCCHHTVYADAYKWLDDDEQVNYSQQAPYDREAEIIEIKPGPKVTPEQSQEAVDALIVQQKEQTEAEQEALAESEQAEKVAQDKAKNCETAKTNLKQYQDNPGRRVKLPDGRYQRLDEDTRQAKMKQFQQDIKQYC